MALFNNALQSGGLFGVSSGTIGNDLAIGVDLGEVVPVETINPVFDVPIYTQPVKFEWLDLSQLDRISFVDLGEFKVQDWNGDGIDDVISQTAYGGGVTWIDGANNSVNRVTYIDPGNAQFYDMNNDGTLDVVSDAFGGVGYFDGTDGQFNRVSYLTPTEYKVADIDADGEAEIVASGALNGTVYFDLDGTVNRLTFNELGDFEIGNIDDDAELEIVSANGQFSNGADMNGVFYYDLTSGSASLERLSYFDTDNFILADANGDGMDQLISNGASHMTGGFIFNMDQTIDRVTFNDLGDDFFFGDLEGNHRGDIISSTALDLEGNAYGGLVSFDVMNGNVTRLSFVETDYFQIGRYDYDGDVEVYASLPGLGDGVIAMDGAELTAY